MYFTHNSGIGAQFTGKTTRPDIRATGRLKVTHLNSAKKAKLMVVMYSVKMRSAFRFMWGGIGSLIIAGLQGSLFWCFKVLHLNSGSH